MLNFIYFLFFIRPRQADIDRLPLFGLLLLLASLQITHSQITKLPVRLRAERSIQPEDALDVSESMLDYTFQQAKDVLSQRRKLEDMQGKNYHSNEFLYEMNFDWQSISKLIKSSSSLFDI